MVMEGCVCVCVHITVAALSDGMLRQLLPHSNHQVIFRYLARTRVASLIAQLVTHLPAMQETRVRFLGWEDPLEKGMATHSSILAWRTAWTEEPGRLQSTGLQESDTT